MLPAVAVPYPLGRWMRGDVEMNDSPSIVSQNQEYVEHLKTDRRNGEEVDRHDGPDVILKEGPPGLRGRLSPTCKVLAHARFADIDAQFEQFAVDSRRTPERIVVAHLANQLSNLWGHRWTAGLAMTDFSRSRIIESFCGASQ